MTLLETVLTCSQLAVLAPLAVLGLHRGWTLARFLRGRNAAPTPRAEPADEDLPAVTVQLPLYNERYVARRLLDAAAALDYPRDRLEIQVLDDSTDDTFEIVAEHLARLPGDLRVRHLHRRDRRGFKAGALAAGLAAAEGELIAVFDADFVPPRDFLRATVPMFADAGVGMVQARWDHLNLDASLLTRMQGVLLDGHFAVEHAARFHAGLFFNFNGTAGVFRRATIDDAGGWQADTLTEDLDLSYRAQLRGWRFCYRGDLVCPAELPVDMNAFVTQQNRWAKGAVQTARKLLGRIWRAPVRLAVKLESAFHLLGNLAFPILLCLIMAGLPLQIERTLNGTELPAWLALVEGLPLLLATCCVLLYFAVSQAALRRPGRAAWARLPLVIAVGAGMSPSNTLAVLTGLFGRTGEFRRTPKTAALDRHARRGVRYRARRGFLPLVEVGFGLWAAATAALALSLALPLTAAFHGLFAGGLLWVGGQSLLEEIRRSRPARIGPKLSSSMT